MNYFSTVQLLDYSDDRPTFVNNMRRRHFTGILGLMEKVIFRSLYRPASGSN
jgi:hypothetical protein